MITVWFNGFTRAMHFRGADRKSCLHKPRRWRLKVDLLCLDSFGDPARVSATVKLSRAMRLLDLRPTIEQVLADLGTDDAAGFKQVTSTWLAISESPAKNAPPARR